jgi:hypothetical protein
MSESIEIEAITQVAKPVSTLLLEILDHFNNDPRYKGRPVTRLSREQIRSKIYAVRAKEFSNLDGIVTQPPMSLCGGADERNFIRFSLNFFSNDAQQKLIGWGHPDLIWLCRSGPVNLFVDCTFKMVPIGKNL